MEIIIRKCRNFEFQINYASHSAPSSTLPIQPADHVLLIVFDACVCTTYIRISSTFCGRNVDHLHSSLCFCKIFRFHFVKASAQSLVCYITISKLLSISAYIAECMYKLYKISPFPITHNANKHNNNMRLHPIVNYCANLCIRVFPAASIPSVVYVQCIHAVYHFAYCQMYTQCTIVYEYISICIICKVFYIIHCLTELRQIRKIHTTYVGF